jgi:2-polyprenyl-3-methyl-5-hydroxy-6-metoxy-1,4-benzoquinol methylase
MNCEKQRLRAPEETSIQKIISFLDIFVNLKIREFKESAFLFSSDELDLYKRFSRNAGMVNNLFDRHVHILSYIEEMGDIFEFILDDSNKMSVLDAGCCIGSDALLLSIFGCDVTGIDLQKRAIELARKRSKYYSSLLQQELNCKFAEGNLLNCTFDHQFDAVWMRESVSHIHPIEEYLLLCYKGLRQGGRIFVSDSNWANPFVKLSLIKQYLKHYSLFRSRGESSIFHTVERRDPISGEMILVAMERVFSCGKLMKLLRDAGFKGVEGRTIGLLPKSKITKLITEDNQKGIAIFDKLVRIETVLKLIFKNRARANIITGTK